MIKKCKFCQKEQEMNGKRIYCNAKCKKAFENAQRSLRKPESGALALLPPTALTPPRHLEGGALAYWNKLAPVLIKRGHLNALSEDIFIELCDLVQRLRDINSAINEAGRSLLQSDDKGANKEIKEIIENQPSPAPRPMTFEGGSPKESALSDIKRKYSKLYLDYAKQFYITPLSNRGNFGIQEEEKDPLDEFIKGQNGK